MSGAMIRHQNATPDQVRLILDWAAAEGWNPGLDDAAAFHTADPDGIFVALDGDLPVAAISVVNHSDAFAFLGLYLCLPSYRGRGIGLALWTHALTHAGARTVGLDGVPAQQGNYQASGFRNAGKTTRYEGALPLAECAQVRPATRADLPDLIEHETAATGWHKPRYLDAWFTPTPTRQTWVLEQTGSIKAFATARRCQTGSKLGPFWASGEAEARALLAHVATQAPAPLIIDVPGTSTGLDAICRDLAMVPGFETARMYRGPVQQASHPFFGVTTLELG